MAAELIRLPVDVIVTHGTGRRVAKRSIATVAIVPAASVDPTAEGLAASLARPGGNITSLSFTLPEIRVKQLEPLLTRISRVAILLP